ncbi:indolepyruvate ferredoxin oxidoreductase subunit alpha [Limnohabitans sp.]|uniref:indolepyruvate ferredoxin oxidoreductase subunit alpha n=1 Tax=Limnohabitans sp. TaxID=1907725 RepID=UPI00286F371F|nr:indolepyruvate ferredoxin oxidoreductase subunit alpha [Limnohabitans sp.]
MAERSFAREVEQLKVPAGSVFRGEGILAVTKALLECGVGYVTGYQGSPISHLMDVLSDAQPILQDLGVYFEPAASEATAAAALAASVNYPVRGAVTWKSTVGTNVASDALANLASGGVTGGALIIVGEDYGEGSSIMQERTHAFAMKSQMWLLDPRPHLPSIVQAVHDGFALSEASHTPVMLQLRIRSCHLHGSFTTRENLRPRFSLRQALEQPQRDLNRIVLPPASFLHEREKIEQRWPAAERFIAEHSLNEMRAGDIEHIGIITLGGLSHNVLRALYLQGLANLFGDSRVPLYILNVAYPLVESEVLRFCADKRAVLVVEEGQPDYHEQHLHTLLRRHGLPTRIHGKDLLPMGGDYTVHVLEKAIHRFVQHHHPAAFAAPVAVSLPSPFVKPTPLATPTAVGTPAPLAAGVLPPRPPGLCVGCPERPIFSAYKLTEEVLGKHHVAADIGCHLFSIMPPFNIGATTMGYGLGAASASAFNAGGMLGAHKKAVAFMGDGGFWHNGLTSGIAHAVFNQHDNVFVIVDNNYSAATGGQDLPSSRNTHPHRSTLHPIEQAVRGVGVQWVRTLTHTYDVNTMRRTLTEAMTSRVPGPKVIVAQSECMLNRQRREKPLKVKAIQAQQRVVHERFGVDAAVCSGDHACMRVSGCPSLSLRPSGDALKPDPVAFVDEHCVACGHCGEVADAAVLCPSFYKLHKIHNARRWERWLHRLREGLLGHWRQREWRQRHAERALYSAASHTDQEASA